MKSNRYTNPNAMVLLLSWSVLLSGLCLHCIPCSEAKADHCVKTTTYRLPVRLSRCLTGYSTYSDVGCVNPCDPACDLTCDFDSNTGCDSKAGSFWNRIELYGWIEGGVYVNSRGNRSKQVTVQNRRGVADRAQVYDSGNSTGLGNVRSTEPMLNQLWLGVKRELDTRRGFDWGFQVDFLYGTDGWLAQSYGDASFDYKGRHRDYYTSLPEAFISFGHRNLSVKVGKFETMLGFEHLQATKSFFYSHSNLFYAEPQSHTGVLFDYKVRPDLWFSFGYVMGSDNSFDNRFDDHGFLGGVYWRLCPAVTVWYTIYAASHGGGYYDNYERHPEGDVFRHTFATNWKITSRWDYSFQWDYGHRSGKGIDRNAHYHGTAHYLTYKINSDWKAGFRFDQIYSRDEFWKTGFARPGTGDFFGNLYSFTLGLNWTPFDRLTIRPELRYDHAADRQCRPFDGGRHRDQFSAGCDFVYRF